MSVLIADQEQAEQERISGLREQALKRLSTVVEVLQELGAANHGDVYELVQDQMSWGQYVKIIVMLTKRKKLTERWVRKWPFGVEVLTLQLIWTGEEKGVTHGAS